MQNLHIQIQNKQIFEKLSNSPVKTENVHQVESFIGEMKCQVVLKRFIFKVELSMQRRM